jgi:hypothetical protein
VLGATASLSFTVQCLCPRTARVLLTPKLQGATYVYYVGYGVKEMPPPALVPITLQPQHGSAISVQSDSYRPAGAQAQIILFTSNMLDPKETYTITVTKTNATLDHGTNIDSFILTQPDEAGSTTPPGTSFLSSVSASASNPPPPSFVAQTTVAAPVVSLGASGIPSTTSNSLAQSGATGSARTSGTVANRGAIVGVLGGLAVGILISLLPLVVNT